MGEYCSQMLLGFLKKEKMLEKNRKKIQISFKVKYYHQNNTLKGL